MGSADKLRTQCEHERVRPTPLDPEPGLAGYSFPFPEGCNAQACNDNAIPQSCGITDLHVVDIASPWSTADGSEKWFAEEDSEEDPDEETCGILAGPSEVTGCDIPKSSPVDNKLYSLQAALLDTLGAAEVLLECTTLCGPSRTGDQ